MNNAGEEPTFGDARGTGTLEISGNAQLNVTTTAGSWVNFYVGRDYGTGTMTMTDNAVFTNARTGGYTVIGGGYGGSAGAGGTGTLTMSGNSSFSNQNELWIGEGVTTNGLIFPMAW